MERLVSRECSRSRLPSGLEPMNEDYLQPLPMHFPGQGGAVQPVDVGDFCLDQQRERQLSDMFGGMGLGLQPLVPDAIDPVDYSRAYQQQQQVRQPQQQRRERQRSPGQRTGETPEVRRRRGRGASHLQSPLPVMSETGMWAEPAQTAQLRQESATERRRMVAAHGASLSLCVCVCACVCVRVVRTSSNQLCVCVFVASLQVCW